MFRGYSHYCSKENLMNFYGRPNRTSLHGHIVHDLIYIFMIRGMWRVGQAASFRGTFQTVQITAPIHHQPDLPHEKTSNCDVSGKNFVSLRSSEMRLSP